ncbi:MAG: ankyrin repeat domain-containing protein [Chloroflexota bacterium]
MSTGTGDFKQFLYAARDGDLENVKYWVRRGVDLDFLHPEFLFAPLHISLRNGHLNVARFLLESGADPLLPEGYTDDTPASIALENKDSEAIALLADFGVEVKNGPWHRFKRAVEKRWRRLVSY